MSSSRIARLAALQPAADTIRLPLGFTVSGVSAGVKKAKTATPPLDLALFASSAPCTAAATFTTNLFAAAPVTLSKRLLDAAGHSGFRALAINAGNANACTGAQGEADARAMADAAAHAIGAPSGTALIMSTGVIGTQLPVAKVTAGIAAAAGSLGSSGQHLVSAARAIMTTDTFPKYASRQYVLPASGTKYMLAGVCKGAGMIHPRMACHLPTNQGTMLGALLTDAAIDPALASVALDAAVDSSFNAVSVDGDTSTNDTVVLLANGMAAAPGSKPISRGGDDARAFQSHLAEFTRDLASRLVWDGEGATKFVAIRVRSHDRIVSKAIAESVATSPLVKTAFFGQDANWGRILCAVGYTSLPAPDRAQLAPETVSLSMRSRGGEIKLVERGVPRLPMDEALAARILAEDEIDVDVDMGNGDQAATYFTCDFSHEYVSINADYRS
ncbi:arginine biosynthesis protein ArgJ [Blastocladiella britannica]|nr:arginine biosynthesis protein ArgJ [Blastocladiella britannica]